MYPSRRLPSSSRLPVHSHSASLDSVVKRTIQSISLIEYDFAWTRKEIVEEHIIRNWEHFENSNIFRNKDVGAISCSNICASEIPFRHFRCLSFFRGSITGDGSTLLRDTSANFEFISFFEVIILGRTKLITSGTKIVYFIFNQRISGGSRN